MAMNPVDHPMVVVQRWLCPKSRTGKLSLGTQQYLKKSMLNISTARRSRKNRIS